MSPVPGLGEQSAIEVTDPETEEVTLFGPFRSRRQAHATVEKMREWGVTANLEVVPLERFSVQALQECGWIPE